MTHEFWDAAGSAAIRIFVPLLNALPERAALGLAETLGSWVGVVSSRRRTVYADLKAAFGPRYSEKERRRLVDLNFRHLGLTVIEGLRTPRLDRENLERAVKIYGWDRYDRAVETGRGIVLLTAHLGNFEFMQIVSGVMGRPIYALGRSQRHRRLNESLNRMRESRGSVTVSSGIAVRDLMRALRRRERVGILGDQSAGRDRGLLVRLFGRRTTLPTGGFELAAKTGAVLLPCFTVRVAPGRHEIHIDEPLAGPGIPVWSLEEQMKRYLRRLEELIAAHPEQWFWAKKRWKYSWTKRLVILSDGKPGHVKQSKAVAEAFRSITDQYGREGMEYPTSIVDVRFRSGWRKRLFYVFAWLFHPWAQGRLEWLKFFFTPETHRALLSAGADFVISAGTALIGLNRCLARECAAKSVVLMKPPFPYNLFRYDLALVPAHDEGPLPAGSLRTLLTPALSDAGEEYEVFYEKMRAELRDPGRVRIGVFLGGPTRRFTFGLAEAKDLMESLEKIPDRHGDFLLTTSRRTPADVDRFLKKNRARFRRCQKMIIASEDPRPGVPEAVRRLCDILIVTQDSVSMISEAVSSGKPVIVLNLGRGRVPVKHRRFREILEREGAVVGSGLSELERALDEAGSGNAAALAAREKAELKKKLEEIL